MRDSGPKAIKEFSVQHCQKYCCDFKVAENDAEDSMQDQQLMKCCLHMWNAIDSGHIGMAVPKPWSLGVRIAPCKLVSYPDPPVCLPEGGSCNF